MSGNIRLGNVIELGTQMSHYKQIEYPMWGLSGEKDFNGVHYSVGGAYLNQPFVMVEETHTHDFDQILVFANADLRRPKDFKAEIEITLGEDEKSLEKYLINYAVCIFIPAGTLHCPLVIKKVIEPIWYQDITLSPTHSVRPLPKASERKK
jgi:hypothetical protein